MGRFHHHADGTVHTHDHDDDHGHAHDHAQPDVGDHRGYATGPERVMVLEHILAENDRIADRNRADFEGAGLWSVNVMSSPGAVSPAVVR